MSKNEREFLDDLRNKSIAAAAEIMESLQRLKLLYDELTDDGSGRTQPRPRTGDFFYRLARFELEHASNIVRLGNSQVEMIFDHVRQLARTTRGGATPTSVVTLELDDGQEEPRAYRGSFEIRNPFAQTADARFQVGALRTANGEVQIGTPKVRCGDNSVRGYQTARVEVMLPADDVQTTLFGDVAVFLSADIERQVAKRALKVRPASREHGTHE